jgi:hypothetical protein
MDPIARPASLGDEQATQWNPELVRLLHLARPQP